MTGVNPGKHGIYDFSIKIPGSYEIKYINRTFNTTYKTIWQLLSEEDVRVGCFNIPMTYPVEKVNGFMISGLGTPGVEK